MHTLEQKRWQLHENGYEDSEVAAYALAEDVSVDVAVLMLWHKLLAEYTERGL